MQAGGFDPITAAINAVSNIVGNALNLAAIKRQGEFTLDSLQIQRDAQHEGFMDQLLLMDDSQEYNLNKSDQSTRNMIKIFTVVIIGIVVLIAVKAIIKKPA